MGAVAKRMKPWAVMIQPGKQFPIDEALALVKQFATAKFDEAVDVAVNLGVDASKSDQQVRGSTVLPHGTGKTVRVAVFTQGKNADAAREAGADIVGLEDLAEKVKGGEINFDVVVATGVERPRQAAGAAAVGAQLGVERIEVFAREHLLLLRLHGDHLACCARKARTTPLVQPKPSCTGYSPPPASSAMSHTSYFSIIFPVSRQTRSTRATKRPAISSARRSWP